MCFILELILLHNVKLNQIYARTILSLCIGPQICVYVNRSTWKDVWIYIYIIGQIEAKLHNNLKLFLKMN